MKGHPNGLCGSSLPPGHEFPIFRHELRNVLNGLLGMASVLHGSGLNGEQLRWLEAIERSARQIEGLIDSCSPSGAGGQVEIRCRPRTFDGIGLLEDILTGHQPLAAVSGHQLLLVAEPGLPRHWRADPCLLRQIADNFVANAIRYARPGEVVLEASASGAGPGWLEVTVSDSGASQAASPGDWMFEAYRRGGGGVGEGGGSGLGLYICRRIAAAIGGEVRWSAGRGEGTSFELIFPAGLDETTSAQGPVTGLFSKLHVSVALEGEMRRCVTGILDRLGVEWGARGKAAPAGRLPLDIRKAHGADPDRLKGPGATALVLAPGAADARLPAAVPVPVPVLETTLGPALLRMALEWGAPAHAVTDRRRQSDE